MKTLKFLFVLFLKQVSMFVDLACTDAVKLAPSPYPCGVEVDYGWPVAWFIGKPGTVITAVGTTPTVAEMVTAMALITAGKIAVINPVSDAALMPENIEIQGPDDLAELIGTRVNISGNIKYLNSDVLTYLRQMGIHKRVQLWWADSNGNLLGGKVGFRASLVYSPIPDKDFGKATKAQIPIKASFWLDPAIILVSAKDEGYLELDNAAV